MAVAQFINYYPKYYLLDNVISITNKNVLNLYIDLKGCCQSLYQEWAVKSIINQSYGARYIDPCIFASLLEFIAFHKRYAKKRDLDLNMIIFFESGSSQYHLDIDKQYKANRKSSDFFGLDSDKRELFFRVLNKNYSVIERVCQKIPDVYVIRLNYLEADFIPYYLQQNILKCDNSVDVIYSCDKDMFQCLNNHTFQFFRHAKQLAMISENDIGKYLLKDETLSVAPYHVPFLLAIAGDQSDNIIGIKGIGYKKAQQVLPELLDMCGGEETIYENIKNNKPIFGDKIGTNNKSINLILKQQDIVSKNLKLVSFKIISNYLNSDSNLDILKKKKAIVSTFTEKNNIANGVVLLDALTKAGIATSVNEQAIFDLF